VLANDTDGQGTATRERMPASEPGTPDASGSASPGGQPGQRGAAAPTSHGGSSRSGATTAQLRRFIKSRPYVPLHERRRRYLLNGHDDDLVPFEIDGRRVWVGLPVDEGRMLGDLVRQGEVGCELALDPASPVVVGVFPIRPVSRA
jgi:hypothetical protein